MNIEYRQIDSRDLPAVAPLTAAFRVALLSYKGIESAPDPAAAMEELKEYLGRGFPVYAAYADGVPVGYMVLRLDNSIIWVESLFVRTDFRRRGIASGLFRLAGERAERLGEDTVFNYVHPNNDGMIAFLRKHGYTVLNLIEIRRPFAGEHPKGTVCVGNHEFDY